MNICIDPILKGLLNNRGITAEVFDAILTKSEKQQMLEDLEAFASRWFIRNVKDITEYRNVSIGAAIHDDVLTLFSYLYHISLVLDKVKYLENTVVFYQSVSCRLPDNVEKMLVEFGIRIKTTNDQYPFLCYKTYFEKSAYTRKTYTGIVYDKYSKTRYISTIKPGIRSLIYKILFKIVNKLYLYPRNIIFLRPMRRLQPLLDILISEGHSDMDIQIHLEFHESKFGDLLNGQNYSNPLRLLNQLVSIAKKGIFLKYSIYMLTPRNDMLSNYTNRKEKLRQIKLIEKTKGSIEKLLRFNEPEISNFFIHEFVRFYLHHFNKFSALINKLHRDVKKNRENNYLVEYINPFLAQVLTNHNRNIFFIHLSRWLNNQYFCKQLRKKIQNRLFILVSSEFERARVLKQGFDKSSIIKVHESYFDNSKVKRKSAYKIYEKKHFLDGKTVLVTLPTLPALFTYRLLIDSTFFMNFISDIVTTLELFNISRIIIRPSPESSTSINGPNFTYADLDNFLLHDIKQREYTLLIRDGLTRNSIQEDLDISDLVIGTTSASAIDAALEGLDYITYDNSVFPFPDSLNLSIFSNESPCPVVSNKDELIKYLETYEPNYGRNIINFPSINKIFEKIHKNILGLL